MRSSLMVEHVNVDGSFVTTELYVDTTITNVIVSVFADITNKKSFNIFRGYFEIYIMGCIITYLVELF